MNLLNGAWFKRFISLISLFLLVFSFFVFTVQAANLDNPDPYNNEDCVYSSICNDGVNVTLEIDWGGSGTKNINFYWRNGILIDTDINVAS